MDTNSKQEITKQFITLQQTIFTSAFYTDIGTSEHLTNDCGPGVPACSGSQELEVRLMQTVHFCCCFLINKAAQSDRVLLFSDNTGWTGNEVLIYKMGDVCLWGRAHFFIPFPFAQATEKMR